MFTMAAGRLLMVVGCTVWVGQAFVIFPNKPSTTRLLARFKDFEGVGYMTQVSKPLGVVFGENPDPYFGLVVDDVEAGLNGGMAGLRVGDNLVAVNGESVVGEDFDTAMGKLVEAEGIMDLQLHRGSVRSLYTILSNMNEGQEEEEELEGEEIIIMDENYESPVRIEVKEEEPLSAADVFNALKKVGSNVAKTLTEGDENPAAKEKKKGGLFGGLFSGETVQLDGDEAKGLK